MKKIRHLASFVLSIVILFSLVACSCENSSNSVDFEKQESEDQEVDEISGVTTHDQKNKSNEESQSNKDKKAIKSETSLTEKSDKTDDSLTKKSDAESTDTKKEENKTSSTISSTKADTAKTTNSTVKSESSGSKSATKVNNTQSRTTTAKTTPARTTTAATTAATTQTPTTSPPTTQPETIRVSLSVECINAYNAGNEVAIAVSNGGWILRDTGYTLQNGATVYDLIINSGLEVGRKSTSYGQYIYSIQSLAEKAVNGQGGWLYFVNGSSPGYGVDSYVLSPGDRVEFSYTLGGY
ncbi:MAG: DUF4430 domain-containing protein [Clostridiaceae bacterium]|nr:DUF4430 domain-containing protein [Bacillota bacterium]NLN52645.1 DUF4430 domain-containing protein [Clostridiaceae bacterium]